MEEIIWSQRCGGPVKDGVTDRVASIFKIDTVTDVAKKKFPKWIHRRGMGRFYAIDFTLETSSLASAVSTLRSPHRQGSVPGSGIRRARVIFSNRDP